MNQITLANAIALGQYIKLLAPLARSSKPFSKRLGRLRSKLDECVVAAVADTVKTEPAEAQISSMLSQLRDAMNQNLSVSALLAKVRSRDQALFSLLSAGKCRRGCAAEDILLAGVEAEANQPLVATATQGERKLVLHAFSSAIHNSSWRASLMGLGLAVGEASTASAWLQVLFGSHPGMIGLDQTLRTLCLDYKEIPVSRPHSRKAQVSAEGLYALQIVLSEELLLANPEVSALATPGLEGVHSDNLSELFAEATRPITVSDGETAATAAQRSLNVLIAGLRDRQQALNVARKKLKKAAEAAATESALEMLKTLSPAMLKVLKNRPDLLNQV